MARRPSKIEEAALPAPAYQQALSQAGLRLVERAGLDGTATYQIGGNTHPHRLILRRLGGEWDKLNQVWLFKDSDPSAALAEAIAASNSAGLQEEEPKPHYHGHRQRLRERFLAGGANALPDYELLELLLFFSIARRDVKPLAKQLIERFGSLGGVLAAPPELLAEFDLDHHSVVHFKALRETAGRLAREEVADRPVIGSWQKLLDYCRTTMAHNKTEQFRLLFLDRKNGLIADEVQQEGTVDHTPVYPREVVKRALQLGASSLIMVHNHPSGDATPSQADIEMTQEVKAAADALGIALHDHVVIGRKGHTSFKSAGLL
ncbi:MAG: DNA repair protein RadC [Rhodospirillales bacterium]